MLCCATVTAQECFADEKCTLFGNCKNLTYTESTAKITIYFPNSTLFKYNESMTNITTGRFNYTFISPSIIGNYMSSIECDVGGLKAYDEDTFTIGEGKMIADQIYNASEIIFLIFIFLIHFILMFIALNKKHIVLLGISSIAGVVASITGIVNVGMITAFGSLMTIFFSGYALFSVGLLGWTAWLYDKDKE